jgi:hypothetical protein
LLSALYGCGPVTGALAIAVACIGRPRSGQAQEQQGPQYEAIRADEDWSVLRNPALRDDTWDRLKSVELPRPEWFLMVAGEARARYEVLDGWHATIRSGFRSKVS